MGKKNTRIGKKSAERQRQREKAHIGEDEKERVDILGRSGVVGRNKRIAQRSSRNVGLPGRLHAHLGLGTL